MNTLIIGNMVFNHDSTEIKRIISICRYNEDDIDEAIIRAENEKLDWLVVEEYDGQITYISE